MAAAQGTEENERARQAPAMSSALTTGKDLFERLLAQGRELLVHDSELFKTAVANLSALVPREGSPVRRAPGAEQKGTPLNGGVRRGATSFRKYDLPDNNSQFEYYQCMVCQERRPTNSFHADHQHGTSKLDVRWYCPLCDTFFAVTHRGYHIKNIHLSKPRDAAARPRPHADASTASAAAAAVTSTASASIPEAPPKRGRVMPADLEHEIKREDGGEDPNDADADDDEDGSLSEGAAPADALLSMKASRSSSNLALSAYTTAPSATTPATTGTAPVGVAGAPAVTLGGTAATATAATAAPGAGTEPVVPTVTSEALSTTLTLTSSFCALGDVQPPLPGGNQLAQSTQFLLSDEYSGTMRPL